MYPPPLFQYPLAPGIIADAQRALWLEEEATLLVADVHLGHLWVERQRGALLPIVPDDTLDRLVELRRVYRPRAWVFLGDTVHAPARIAVLEEELRRLIQTLSESGATPLHFVLGNHDPQLGQMISRLGLQAPCSDRHTVGRHLLIHGDAHTWSDLLPWVQPGGFVIHGHQHPASLFADGIATTVKAPCFLLSGRRIVLPAFSRWAAHVPWNAVPCLTPLAEDDPPRVTISILGDRLLPMRLGGG